MYILFFIFNEYIINTIQNTKTRFLIFLLFISFNLSPICAQQLSRVVNPKIGTQGSGLGCGFNFVGATYPFGMVQFTPSFFSPNKGFVIKNLRVLHLSIDIF